MPGIENLTLVLMQGPPGSGKSTAANAYLDALHNQGIRASLHSADMFFNQPDGSYKFNPNLLGKAHESCRNSCERAMLAGHQVVIIDNTNIRRREAEPYKQLALEYGYDVTVLRMLGEYQNVHGVPDEKVAQMKASMEELV